MKIAATSNRTAMIPQSHFSRRLNIAEQRLPASSRSNPNCGCGLLRGGIDEAGKMKLPYYEAAAFTQRAFGGNPAGICLLEKPLPDSLLQSIASENNLAETAFVVPR